MGKYSDIVDSSWVDMTIYAESIPHLFHWDLAYMWILEKDHLKPEAWESKIEAWRYLVALLLVGELDIEVEPINTPFLYHTQPYGVASISWVRLRETSQRVGVLSPAVMVRPLPDFKDSDLKQWLKTVPHPEQNRGEELAHFAGITVLRLRESQRADSFRSRLADILEREFQHRDMRNPPGGAFQTIHMLSRLFWAQEPDGPCVEPVEFVMRRAAGGVNRPELKTYIPHCERCATPLTKVQDAPPIIIEQNQFSVLCHKCAHDNTLELSKFLIWLRNRTSVVVWDQQGVLTTLDKGFPPVPTIHGIEVQFEWGPAQIGGERHRRFMRLNFPEKEITIHKISEIFYTQVLVLGDFACFTGLPVRPDWLDALSTETAYTPDVDVQRKRLLYRGLLINGWPEPYKWPVSAVKEAADLAIGVYPNTQDMPDEWKFYRTFITGETRGDYRLVTTAASRQILPWLHESADGRPQVLSVLDKMNPDIGVTYLSKPLSRSLPETDPTTIFVGIDFGTTNTIVYAMRENQQGDVPNPEVHGVKPSALLAGVGWIAESVSTLTATTVGDFLPGKDYAADQPDPYIIPTALWEIQQQYLIRWSDDEPLDTARPHSDFKLDTTPKEFYNERKAFLYELLWLVIPHILRTITLKVPATFKIGYAFPLALDYTARKDMNVLMRLLGESLTSSAYTFEFHSTDESHACMRAFGSPNPDDTYLIADMGGGTMDIALFKGRSVLQSGSSRNHDAAHADSSYGKDDGGMLQIGSIEFAGGDFVRALVAKKESTHEGRERFKWKLRDLIRQGRCHAQYGSDTTAQNILQRYTGMAFEFLRTMAASHLRNQADEINLVLVGNGWHLAEAFDSETGRRKPSHVFNEFYSNLVCDLGFGDSLKFYNHRSEILHHLPSSKHLVVIGALKNTIKNASVDYDEMMPSKLPAGRSLEIKVNDAVRRVKKIEWYDLVGEGVLWRDFTTEELTGMDSEYSFNLDDMPPLRADWLRYLLGLFKVKSASDIPYPDKPALREQVQRNIQNKPPRLFKGPLQIIIERSWKDKLRD